MSEEPAETGIPEYPDDSTPVIADPAVGAREHDWHPANKASIKAVCCLEAIRDMALLFRFLSFFPDSASSNRFVKSIATPLYSLATGIRDVYGEMENLDLKQMRKEDRRAFLKRKENFSNAVFQGRNGPLKTVRDKIGAHIDQDVIVGGEHVWKHVNLRSFVVILRVCLIEFDFLLQQDIYAWARKTDHPNLVRLMRVDGTLVDFVAKAGELEYIKAISFVKSPREAIASEVNEFVADVNLVVAAISLSPTINNRGQSIF